MTAPTRLSHIVHRTNELKVMCDWYCAVLEAHVVFANDRIAFLTYDDEHHRIAFAATAEFAPRPTVPTVGFYHVAFTYETLGDLLDTYERLLAAGIRPWRTINHGPTMSFYYADPDGNDVELQVDRFKDPLDAQTWMHGTAFANNPIGIEVRPEDLRRRLEDGEPFDSIMVREDELAL
ncbi:biphenyl 2,3-dioxygenase [Sphingobium sp. SCG-1]|uniref:VOC family protein n=1 Tax=Sphingobium sp. SCG-1 TaxID=2072936 RepID=UPI000CD6A04C|nr:VOC family protein [Sphingobium sp. SCG-1]AUW57795.1 biphenyl 2,3-dioxygenase [Sphingobium sp. SCG-1]